MTQTDKALSALERQKSDISAKAWKVIYDLFPYLVLLMNIAVSILSRPFRGWLENPFSADFFISLSTNILTTMFSYSCFVRHGEQMTKLTMRGYAENSNRWSVLSGKVRGGMGDSFARFCTARVEKEREERRREIIGNHTMISYDRYEQEYKGKSRRYIEDLRKSGKLSRRDAYAILRANGQIRVKPINPLIILCGISRTKVNDAGRENIRYSTLSIISRPFTMLIVNIAVTMFKWQYVGLENANEIYNMLISAFMIVMASAMGYSAGATSARKEHDKIKNRIFFIERFLEAEGQIQEP